MAISVIDTTCPAKADIHKGLRLAEIVPDLP